MSTELNLLLLEDSADDAALIQLLLRRAGLSFRAQVASDEREFLTALYTRSFDAVLADNALPQYNSLEALKLVRATNPQMAFILVTGTISEEFAVSIIQQGADDYILKTNLTRLPSAVSSAIEKKRTQQEKEMEKDLSDRIINSLPGVFYLYNQEGHFLRWNRNLETVSGYTLPEVTKMKPADFFEAPVRGLVNEWIAQVFAAGYAETEAMVLTKNGDLIPYLFTGTTISYGQQTCLLGIGVDITAGKESERELKQLNEQLRSLSAHSQHVREEEQKRIAREIHDELGQQITGMKMDLQLALDQLNRQPDPLSLREKLSRINALLDETIVTIRKISAGLRPSILDDLGLVAALDWQSVEFEKRYGIPVRFSASDETIEMAPELMTGFFRMYQESLTNIARHAQATQVTARFETREGFMELTVSDNGNGFDLQKAKDKKTLGLLGMNERALLIGGTVVIESRPGEGTRVRIRV